MFSNLPKINFYFSVTFDLLSANALLLDQSKILSFGKAVIYFMESVGELKLLGLTF